MSLKNKLSLYFSTIKWAMRYPVPTGKKYDVFHDYIKFYHKKGITHQEYFDYEFENSSEEFRKSFLGLNEQRYYLDYLNPIKYYSLTRNKYLSHKILDDTGIKKPQLYCYYHPEASFTKSTINAGSLQDVLDILKTKCINSCVIKTTESSHGDNVEVVKAIKYIDNDAILTLFNDMEKYLSSLIGKEPLIIEEVIEQSESFSRFNKSSVNTIRIMTNLYPNGEAKVIAAFIKIGRAGKCIDNAGSGGNVDACINIETGEITHVVEYNGFRKIKNIENHPDNGNRILGQIIENWEDIKRIVCQYQKALPYCKAAGWDIAITDEGPIAIEVNDMWDQIGQLFIQKGWREEIRKCFLEWKKTGNKYPLNRQKNALSLSHLKTIASYE